MPGRGFLRVAQDVVAGKTEYHWRAASVHAYYALLLECRDALDRWGFIKPRADNVHHWVRLRFSYASEADLKALGQLLDSLVRLRNDANYDLGTRLEFSSPRRALQAIRDATAGLTLLDDIDTDPVRRAAAVASLRP